VREQLRNIFITIENKYNFQCEGGPLRNCADWRQLGELLERIEDAAPPAQEQTEQAWAEAAKMREALKQITALPSRPAPDPGAHSWEAFGKFWMGVATDMKFKAINALASPRVPDATDGKEETK